MWRVLKIVGWSIVGLVVLAIAREGWQQVILAVTGVLFAVFCWGALFGDL
jgi:hypothetical protein